MTAGTKAGTVGFRPVDERLERSTRCIRLARAQRWNGALPAAMVGGGLSPILSLR